MNGFAAAVLTMAAVNLPPTPDNWCRVGQTVIIPDGREGPVAAISGDYCSVLVYGEKYLSLWAYYLIEPAYPRLGR